MPEVRLASPEPRSDLWDFHVVAMNPDNDWCGREGIDFLRHDWRANVLFVDGHVENVTLTERGMSAVGLSRGMSDDVQ